METLTRPINLMEISYPVFCLGKDRPQTENGVVLYITRTRQEDSEELITTYKIVDDKNVEGNTLALRRLRLLREGVPLKKISRTVFFLGDLVKVATSAMWFIDSAGVVFRYVKHTRTKLEFKKIKNVINISTGGAIIEVEGIPSRFKSLFAPKPSEIYAGVLKYGVSYILYGFYMEQFQDTWRLI